jgi:hypothetical protein
MSIYTGRLAGQCPLGMIEKAALSSLIADISLDKTKH